MPYMRTTIKINDKIYKAVKHQAAETGESISSIIEDAVKFQVLEDLADTEAIKKRESEPKTDFKQFVNELKEDGLI
ncbi:MAG: ribbon-helix-helix domain-containing protein [Candidatus Spechtbacterales bacterium]